MDITKNILKQINSGEIFEANAKSNESEKSKEIELPAIDFDLGARILEKDIDPQYLNVHTGTKVAVYNSPFYRTRQTAQLIKQSIAPYVVREVEDARFRFDRTRVRVKHFGEPRAR